MRATRDAVHISAAEWRWVLLVGCVLLAVAFLPFVWVFITNAAGQQWQFMGMLNNYRDGATYLAKMRQGAEGEWLVAFRHTPDPHNAIFIQIIYPALGHLSRLTRIPAVVVFHVARVVASLIMYMALYQLAATIYPHRLRPRRIFFLLCAFGSGLGWLLAPLTGDTTFPDLVIPEIFPFYSSLMNVHFPLTIACLSLLATLLIIAFSPGSRLMPTVAQGGLIAGLLGLAIALLYPQALVPFGLALGVYVASSTLRLRRLPTREIRWVLVILLPALPVAVYLYAVMTYNPAVAEWTRQNTTLAPSPLVMIFGLGVPLFLAVPGILRALRRFDQDGDQFMLIWLVAFLVAIYFPTAVQRRFAVGLMIPVAFFATRALEGFWLQHFARRWRTVLAIMLVPLVTLSQVIILLGNFRVSIGPFLPRDYAVSFRWLESHTSSADVLLASPDVSIWVPGWVGARVVYGHPYETLQAERRERQVLDWYGATEALTCRSLIDEYRVQYVLFGPEEEKLGAGTCVAEMTPAFTYGSVTVYAP